MIYFYMPAIRNGPSGDRPNFLICWSYTKVYLIINKKKKDTLCIEMV